MSLSITIHCGGNSGEDPPLPIPNREVKLTSADGTAIPGGRVGSCRSSRSRFRHILSRDLSFYPAPHHPSPSPLHPSTSHTPGHSTPHAFLLSFRDDPCHFERSVPLSVISSEARRAKSRNLHIVPGREGNSVDSKRAGNLNFREGL